MDLAIHSTHEAAAKIAGIGAVLDGVLPQATYVRAYPSTLLAGAFPLETAQHALTEILFDSADGRVASELKPAIREALAKVADGFGTRVVFGRRQIGTASKVGVDVLLVSPHGLRQSRLQAFHTAVGNRFGFDLSAFQASYVAIGPRPDESLARILNYYDALDRDPRPIYPASVAPEEALLTPANGAIYGGVQFQRRPDEEPRAVFPAIRGLDAFAGFERMNSFLVELEFYVFAAAPLWQAVRSLIDHHYRPNGITFVAHDWLGVPLFWAMKLDDTFLGAQPKLTTAYFAHEARLARMLVEGTIHDKAHQLRQRCHPDGHDAAFYAYLSRLEPTLSTVDDAFPEVRTKARAFDDIYHHLLNKSARHFNRIVAVGQNVKRETEWILRGEVAPPTVALVPNGVPDFTARAGDVADTSSVKAAGQEAARRRLVEFARRNIGFEPDVIFTAVNRCELSKAPWRNLDVFRAFVDAPENRNRKAIFIWLSRPKPLPAAEQIKTWTTWGWPLEHKAQTEQGDLRSEELALWRMIAAINKRGVGRYALLYVNQFGWEGNKLGALDPVESRFSDLRQGTDVEIGLSVYEPFGIAPLEPFSSGAICVVSDASGCALHLQSLQRAGSISDSGFVVGRFAADVADPGSLDLTALREIEARAYAAIVSELRVKLAIPREKRLRAAQEAMPALSWAAATSQLLEAVN